MGADLHVVDLAEPIGSIHRLHVEGGVPLWLEDDHLGGRYEVDAEAACLSREEEEEDERVLIEVADAHPPLRRRGRPVETLVPVPLPQDVRLQDVEHLRVAREEKHLRRPRGRRRSA